MFAFHRKRVLISLVPSAVSFLFFQSPASAGVSGHQDISVINRKVKGRTQSSFYPPRDLDYIYQGSLGFKENAGGREYSGAFDYTFTDDRGISPRRFTIGRLSFGYRDDAVDLRLGDHYARFSEYTLDNPLKGAELSFGEPGQRRLRLVAGVDTPVWPGLSGGAREPRRYVWGARLENPLGEKGNLNLSYAGGIDDKEAFAGDAPRQTNVFGIDGDYRLTDRFSVNGELAGSVADTDTRAGGGAKTSAAARAGFNYVSGPVSAGGYYTRAGRDFSATGRFPGADREDYALNGTLSAGPLVLSPYFRHTRVNISAGGDAEREANPGVKAVLSLPKGFTAEVGADARRRRSGDGEVDVSTDTYRAAIGKSFGAVRARAGYSRTAVNDRRNPGNRRDIDALSLGLEGNAGARGARLSWRLGGDFERARHRSNGKPEHALLAKAAVAADFPSSLRIEAQADVGRNNNGSGVPDRGVERFSVGVSRDIGRDTRFSLSAERKRESYSAGAGVLTESFVKASVRHTF